MSVRSSRSSAGANGSAREDERWLLIADESPKTTAAVQNGWGETGRSQ